MHRRCAMTPIFASVGTATTSPSKHHSLSKEQMDKGRSGGSKHTPLPAEPSQETYAHHCYAGAGNKYKKQTLSQSVGYSLYLWCRQYHNLWNVLRLSATIE